MALTKDERQRIADILSDWVAKTYSDDKSYREFQEYLIEEWRRNGKLPGISERDAFLELVTEALDA